MPIRAKSLAALFLGGATAVLFAACSSSSGTTITTNGNGSGAGSPGSLVSTCDTICNNLAPCGSASLDANCLSVCDNLNIVPASCVDSFASYLACLAGAKSVSCQAGGQYVLVTPPECQSDRQAFVSCNAGPSIVSACLGLSGNTSCAATAPAEKPVFCVGAPSGCTPPNPNPLGIGVYCCP
jgi:hypothetical protein